MLQLFLHATSSLSALLLTINIEQKESRDP